ncbi:hypothetical protein ANCCAN_02157 [Ancylostoma caninum]|uniref:Uncharacterized protein n=1 Tax=Ancylostoma caninum TaxID=29170 RepID=A0A368H907_ANCCA|nr:hypothetical protein ANCCAN_02157 [Ancylostoma caninum]
MVRPRPACREGTVCKVGLDLEVPGERPKDQPKQRSLDTLHADLDQELRGAYINKVFEKELPKDNYVTVTPASKQLEKFLSTGENVDSLYALFSDLLDRKLKELNTTRDQATEEAGDDIQDDYMREMTTGSNAGSHVNIRQALASESLQVNDPYQRGGRRQSTGGMRDQRKSFHWTDNHNV